MVERIVCTLKAFINIAARESTPPACQKYLAMQPGALTNATTNMHDCQKTEHTCMHACYNILGAIAEVQNSLPTPWCHVCIWSGGLSVAPPPGREWRLGSGSRTADDQGLSCTHGAVDFMFHHSLCVFWSGKASPKILQCHIFIACVQRFFGAAKVAFAVLVNPLLSWWAFPCGIMHGAEYARIRDTCHNRL